MRLLNFSGLKSPPGSGSKCVHLIVFFEKILSIFFNTFSDNILKVVSLPP